MAMLRALQRITAQPEAPLPAYGSAHVTQIRASVPDGRRGPSPAAARITSGPLFETASRIADLLLASGRTQLARRRTPQSQHPT